MDKGKTDITLRDIRKTSLDELTAFFFEHGEDSFRAKQVDEWIWKKSCTHFDAMTNLSLSTRTLLKKYFIFNFIHIDRTEQSQDGTIKNAVRLHDDLVIESALIPSEKRVTACVSSQAGCSLDCTFCATAQLKRMRNLSADEIYDQVIKSRDQSMDFFNKPLTNIVFMGMGEPLLNYANVLASIEKITSPKGLNFASRRITLSTAGIAKMIVKMADENVKFNLAISLHAALNKTRSTIMSINNSNSLDDLSRAVAHWYAKTNHKVTYEYIIWKGVNDDMEHAEALVALCKKTPSKVNFIEYNPIQKGTLQQADDSVFRMYQELLRKHGIVSLVRKSRGQDINAACGQLANLAPHEGRHAISPFMNT